MFTVYGHGGDLLKSTLTDGALNWVLQAEQLGTGHAMQQAAPHFADDEDVLMLYGDVPLISVDTLQRLLAAAAGRHRATDGQAGRSERLRPYRARAGQRGGHRGTQGRQRGAAPD